MRRVKLLNPRLFRVHQSLTPMLAQVYAHLPAAPLQHTQSHSLGPLWQISCAKAQMYTNRTARRFVHSLSIKRTVLALTSLQNFLSSNSKHSHLYMRSMSISGSSWNSLIFTVSDRMLFRLHSSSSTCSNTKTNMHFSDVCFPLLEKQQHLHQMMLLSPLPKEMSGCWTATRHIFPTLLNTAKTADTENLIHTFKLLKISWNPLICLFLNERNLKPMC